MDNSSKLNPISLPPLNKMPEILASELSGTSGSNRDSSERCQIRADNDYDALYCWLNEYKETLTTYKTYQKEAEQFLLWSIIQKRKPLSSLDRDDLEDYIQFLDDPKPHEIWCTKKTGRNCKRGDSKWRPFTGPLGPNAKKTAISSIDSLLDYLVQARYLSFNPLSLIRKRHSKMQSLQRSQLSLQERMLELDEWEALINTLENYPEATQKERDEKARSRFLVHILYFLGLRINELATHTWNAFRQVEGDWWFYVLGKGNKIGRIPVNDELLRSIIQYRAYLKKFPYPSLDEEEPLIASLKGEPITPRHINKILKKLAITTSKIFSNQPEKMRKLQKFSAHWLRHFSASMQDRVGISFKHIRANHRHENDETTRKYVHAIDRERHQEMQKLSFGVKWIRT